ncbi:MAG: nucleotide exchange factor GrpE [Thermoanaerobaculales bacterium]
MSEEEAKDVQPLQPRREGEGLTASEQSDDDKGLAIVIGEETIQDELAKLQQEVTNLKELYLRKLADFDNYRKRHEREAMEFRRSANADLIRECLPVLDNLERALAVPGGDDSGLRKGVELVVRQYQAVLARYGLVQIDPLGATFDPAAHEAIQRQEVAGIEETKVVLVLQKGYRLGEKLLRPALVVVAVPAHSAVPLPASDNSGE